MLEYALGRELDGVDECSVREIHAAMRKDGYKFSALVTESVKSVHFRQRRGFSPGRMNSPANWRGRC